MRYGFLNFMCAIGAMTFARKVFYGELDRIDAYLLSAVLFCWSLLFSCNFLATCLRWLRKRSHG